MDGMGLVKLVLSSKPPAVSLSEPQIDDHCYRIGFPQGTSTCPAKHATPSGVRPVPAVAVPRATSFLRKKPHEKYEIFIIAALWCWKFSTMSWRTKGIGRAVKPSEAQVRFFFHRFFL